MTMGASSGRGETGVGAKSAARAHITSTEMLYAHALAIENEAVRSYREFAQRMADLGDDMLADLFRRLESLEQGHLLTLKAKTAAMQLPALAPGEYAWLDNGAPVPEARELVFRMMTPRLALDLALVAEKRAKAFFESIRGSARDRDIRMLAGEFADEEQIHIDTIQFALDGLPEPCESALGHNSTRASQET